MLQIAICDDEAAQRSLLETYVREWGMLRQLETDIALSGSAEQFLFCWEERPGDMVLLDIDMPGADGLSLAKRLRSQGDETQIIFVTGLAEYALEGYDVDAVSYLIKPVRKDRLFACLDRAAKRCGQEAPALLLDTPGGMARVRIRDICYLESAAHDTWVHCNREKEPVRCRVGIRQLEERLGQQGGSFFKIHRSYLVNLSYVNRIEKREAVMDTGEALPVARNRWEALNRAYLEYYRGRWEREEGADGHGVRTQRAASGSGDRT